MRSHYPYAALLEFDDIPGLKAYLDHPVHAQLATRFFEAFEEALMYDYELREGAEGVLGCPLPYARDIAAAFQLGPAGVVLVHGEHARRGVR